MADDIYLQPFGVRDFASLFPTDWLLELPTAAANAPAASSSTSVVPPELPPPDIDCTPLKAYSTVESVIKNEVGARLAAWPAKHAFEYVHARAAKASAADSSASAFGRKRNKSKPKKVPSKAVQVPVPRTEEEKRKDEEAITALMATLPTYASLREKINKMFATSRFLDSLGRGRTEWRGAERNLLDHSAAPPPDAGDAVQAGETVLRVSVYNQSKRGKIQQEFLVLGSQRLTELKDRVYCLSDFMLDGRQEPGSYFYIEGTFFEDFRKPAAASTATASGSAEAATPSPAAASSSATLAGPVVDWMNDASYATVSPSGWGTAAHVPMETATFGDLALRVGAHYLYCHQGNCEHIIVFSDLRLHNPRFDHASKSAYPLHCYQRKVDRKMCCVCNAFAADFVTYGDKLAESHPAYFCMHCYHPLHYNASGDLICEDFQVMPYFHQ